jgi:curved DNA-binding protein CbpA
MLWKSADTFARSQKHQDYMKGKLNDQPGVELIREICSRGFSGTLRLDHERAKTAVYFEDGRVIFAASNVRTLRLREYLRKSDLVSEKDLAAFENNCSDLKLAALLEANGLLPKETVNTLLAAVVADTLRVALLWTDGNWEFDARAHFDETARISVDTGNLLREAALRLPLKFVSLRFRNPGEMISRSADIGAGTHFLPAESFLMSRLDAPSNLETLVAMSGLQDLDAYRIIYGLTLSGLLKREYWQNAFRAEVTKATSEQADLSQQAPVVQAEPPDARWAAVNEEEADVERFLARLNEAADYYEVIDMPRTAGANEIKDAYYSLARRYHPDRFHVKSGTQLHTQISSAFARITQAYETLTKPDARAAYDRGLERSKQFADSAPKSDKQESPKPAPEEVEFKKEPETEAERAENNFREGFGALQQGRADAAASHLAIASRLAPADARYRAYYGRALAANEKTRRLAENEIQAAVKLEPANALYRTMLAELYFDLKFHRRAQTELDKALALDPTNAGALSLLRKLENSRKVG